MKYTLLILLSTLIITSIQISCNSSELNKTEREGQATIYNVESEDKEMLAASEKSRKTFDEFLRVYQLKDSSIQDFAIKVPFKTEKGNEHIWLNQISIEQDKIFGIVSNAPSMTEEVKLGQKVEINRDNITDWNYIKEGRLFGGYTIKILRNRMSQQERAEFDASTGLIIE